MNPFKLPNLYDFNGYKKYLNALIELNRDKRGINLLLSEALQCHRSFLSRILNGEDHLSLECIMNFCESQALSQADADYLLKIFFVERSEQQNLRKYFNREIEEIHKKRARVGSRVIQAGSVSSYATDPYYRSWVPSAVHVLTSTNKGFTTQQIARRLKLNEKLTTMTLEELEQSKLVTRSGDAWKYAGPSIHLDRESPLYVLFHQTWSDRALGHLMGQESKDESVHFTGVISVNRNSGSRVREVMLRALDEIQQIVASSQNEDDVACVKMDFFYP